MKKLRSMMRNLNNKISGNHGATLLVSVIKLILLVVAVLVVLNVAEKLNTIIWAAIEQVTPRDVIIAAGTAILCIVLCFLASGKKHNKDE